MDDRGSAILHITYQLCFVLVRHCISFGAYYGSNFLHDLVFRFDCTG